MEFKDILDTPKTIAIVGLSDKVMRPSYVVALYLIKNGFTVIPVNPMIKKFHDIDAYPSISSIPSETHIDIVDIFRRSEEVEKIVKEVIHLKIKPLIWMQEGVISESAMRLAEDQGLEVVMDQCIMKVHRSIKQ